MNQDDSRLIRVDGSRSRIDVDLLMHKAQSPGSDVASLNVDWPTDLSGEGEALRDLFEPQRSTFHREAVTAAGGGASRRCPEDAGHHEQSGEPPQVHGGLIVSLCAPAGEKRENMAINTTQQAFYS